MDIKEELVKALVKLDIIQEDLQEFKALNKRVDALEDFKSRVIGAIGIIVVVVPLLVEWYK